MVAAQVLSQAEAALWDESDPSLNKELLKSSVFRLKNGNTAVTSTLVNVVGSRLRLQEKFGAASDRDAAWLKRSTITS